jgi:hypothetical protein
MVSRYHLERLWKNTVLLDAFWDALPVGLAHRDGEPEIEEDTIILSDKILQLVLL